MIQDIVFDRHIGSANCSAGHEADTHSVIVPVVRLVSGAGSGGLRRRVSLTGSVNSACGTIAFVGLASFRHSG